MEQFPGNAEQQNLPGHPPVEGEHGVAQGTEGHEDGDTGDFVVGHLVVHQHPQRVHVDLAVQSQHTDHIVAFQPGVR